MKLQILGLLTFLLIAPGLVQAADRKMVIQVNTKDATTQKMAINSAKNLKKLLGKESVDVEVVVYGPGLSLIKSSGSNADKVTALMSDYGVKISACKGALKAYAKRHGGRELDIVEGVTKVATGAIRILELQEQGYAYLRP
ncbi:MAG: DsrE family protein [Thiotrichaceae bacterium]|nr:DsrE family protein [Thiotrichaceae bacterium]